MKDILKRYWGYDSFRPMQEEIISSVLSGHDTLGLLPTGGGKSITFQVPALMLPGLTLVVTPLISLMKDQVDNLTARGVRAVLFHSGLTRREKNLAMTRCRLGEAKIAYISPERLHNEEFIAELRGLTVSLLVVDEAHCISQWGYDFRPSYLHIAPLRRILGPDVPVLALTASATAEVRDDIMRSLRFREPRMFSLSFARQNLSYIVRYADFKDAMLLKILKGTSGCSIVYVRSRRRTRELAEFLNREGISASAYHAGLAPEEKNERQNLWKEDRIRVMVATNAFGMGIDKPDVRVVVHFDLPSSLEEYYQEAGRGGRDGKHSYAVAIVGKPDKGVLTRRISESFPDKEFIAHVYEMVGNFLDVAVGDGFDKVYEFDLAKFCTTFNLPPSPTESALRLLTRSGYLEYIAETTSRSRLMVIMNKEALYSLDLDPVTEEVFQGVLRRYTGLFADYVNISEVTLSRDLTLSTQTIYEALLYLSRLHAIHYIPQKTTPYIHYTTSREEPRHLIIPIEVYERQRERMERRIEAVKEFAFNSTECRANTLLRYFGETPTHECGTCDVCRSKKRAVLPTDPGEIEKSILYHAARPGGTDLQTLLSHLSGPREVIIDTLRHMADDGRVTLSGLKITC
ncbi:MAG: RecQ family ATP-dependent DNA helicase [Muribaculaceae bacterium]|nr:RecQ family ATP-dependent DNA helicase [Muribaculaceae bacterium]